MLSLLAGFLKIPCVHWEIMKSFPFGLTLEMNLIYICSGWYYAPFYDDNSICLLLLYLQLRPNLY